MSVCLSVCWLVKQRHPPIIRNGPYGAKVGVSDRYRREASARFGRGEDGQTLLDGQTYTENSSKSSILNLLNKYRMFQKVDDLSLSLSLIQLIKINFLKFYFA